MPDRAGQPGKAIRGGGSQVTAVFATGTDFGAQNGPFISPKTYRELYLPFHKQVNAWIHRHTPWKSLIHSCDRWFS